MKSMHPGLFAALALVGGAGSAQAENLTGYYHPLNLIADCADSAVENSRELQLIYQYDAYGIVPKQNQDEHGTRVISRLALPYADFGGSAAKTKKACTAMKKQINDEIMRARIEQKALLFKGAIPNDKDKSRGVVEVTNVDVAEWSKNPNGPFQGGGAPGFYHPKQVSASCESAWFSDEREIQVTLNGWVISRLPLDEAELAKGKDRAKKICNDRAQQINDEINRAGLEEKLVRFTGFIPKAAPRGVFEVTGIDVVDWEKNPHGPFTASSEPGFYNPGKLWAICENPDGKQNREVQVKYEGWANKVVITRLPIDYSEHSDSAELATRACEDMAADIEAELERARVQGSVVKFTGAIKKDCPRETFSVTSISIQEHEKRLAEKKARTQEAMKKLAADKKKEAEQQRARYEELRKQEQQAEQQQAQQANQERQHRKELYEQVKKNNPDLFKNEPRF